MAGLRRAFAAAVVLAAAAGAQAQYATPPGGTEILDASLLRPPAGARVAIVEFGDMECPVCATTNPILKKAVDHYKIPWVRRDLLIPSHNWSLYAAVNARWFDAKSKALGGEYRDQVFASQSSITDPGVLAQFTMTFAKSHKIELPFAIDPQGKLAAEVKADSALGLKAGINHTPTVFVVTANGKGAPFVEVQNPSQDLNAAIDKALADTAPAGKPPAPKKVAAK